MIFEKVFSVSLFFIVFSTFGSYAESSINGPDSNYKNCNEAETNQFISLVRNIAGLKNRFFDQRFVVLTDKDTKMYEPLREKLIQEDSIFIPFHRTFNHDIQETFEIASAIRYVSHVKFLIHANTLDDAVSIFQNLTNIFPNTALFHKSIAFVISRLSENQIHADDLMLKLKEMSRKSNRTDLINFIELYDGKIPFASFTIKPSELNVILNELIQWYKTDNIVGQENFLFSYYKFNFHPKYQSLIECGKKFLEGKIAESMVKYSKSLESRVRILEEEKNATSGSLGSRTIWSFIKSNTTNDVESYLQKLTNCTESVESKWRDSTLLTFQETNSTRDVEDSFRKFVTCFKDDDYRWIFSDDDDTDLRSNMETLAFLSHYAKSPLGNIALAWTEPLKNFTRQYLKRLEKFYCREDGGRLFLRKVDQSCMATRKEYTLYVRGYSVKLSDLNFQLCRVDPKVIEIFAIEEVIIDVDVSLIGKMVEFVIIAPKWFVISSSDGVVPGRRIINLSGSNGKSFEEQQAKNGTTDGNRNGANGMAGNPGGPAGSFYGAAEKIVNAEKLTVLADGGRGGDGQHGGHGVDGADGLFYKGVPVVECGKKLKGWDNDVKSEIIPTISIQDVRIILYTHKIKGKSGKLGGRGGNGGIGGMEGKKGFIIIKELSNNKILINSSAMEGQPGSNGIGGKAGLGGKNGREATIECEVTNELPKKSEPKYSPPETERGKMGISGQTGISLKNRKIAESSEIPYSFPSEINRYKKYIRSHLAGANFTQKEKLWPFYNALNTHENITKMYDTISLVDDFMQLEKQFFFLNRKMNFTSSYEQLKTRIEKYGEILQIQGNKEHGDIIRDLKIDMRYRLGPVRSVNSYYAVNTKVQKQLKSTILPMIRQLEKFRSTKEQLLILEERIYELDDAMKSGEKLIVEVAHNAIADTEETLDQEVDSLLKEIIEMQEKELDNEQELLKSREKLKNTMQLKALFGVLKVGCGVLGIINPALGLAGAVAVSALTVIEAKTTGDGEALATVIPKSVEILAKESENYFKQLKEKQDKIIKEQESEVNKILDEQKTRSQETVKLVQKIWFSAQRYRENNGVRTFEAIQGYGMTKVYADQERQLTEEFEKLPPITDNTTIILQRQTIRHGLNLAKFLKVSSEALKSGSESALSILKDEKKITEIDVAIDKSLKTMEKLNSIEENIYSEVEPMLNDMKTNLDSIKDNIKSMNKFKQAIAKWNVTRTLDEIKRNLNNVSRNFTVNEDINFTINQLIKTFDLLFEEHKLLLENKEEQQDKIDKANFHTAHASNIKIQDSKLRYALSELQVVSLSNSVAEDYQEWISSFKQYAFPYIGEKLPNLQDLETYRAEGVDYFANFIINNIQQIIKASQFDIFTDDNFKDDYWGSNSDDEETMIAFYNWTADANKEAIKNILNGSAITLVANINNTNFHADAIKLSRVKLLFITKHPKQQKELNKLLKNYIVYLKHHGDSKYKFGRQLYEFRNSPTNFQFKYDVNDKKKESKLVTKLSKGPCLLSPYATWTIQLVKINGNRTFSSLQKFTDINLELVGNAEYITKVECDLTCEKEMRNYYTFTTATDLTI